VLATLPKMLGEIVKQLVAAQPDLELAGEVEDRDALSCAVRRTCAHVVVAGVAAGGQRALAGDLPYRLLREHPGLRLIALADDGRAAYVYELRLHETAITEISPRALLDAIRNAHPAPGG
jgi:hypothetical protein